MWARHFVGKIFVFIDALKYSAIPFCISFLLSILIIQRVFRAEGISAQLQNLHPLTAYRSYPMSPSDHSNSVLNQNNRVGRRVTVMLLSVSIAFCIFSAPMSLMQIVQSISKPSENEVPLAIGKAIAELCQYVNHSSNFFLYALTGRTFRREFVRLFFPTRFGGRSAMQNVRLPKESHSPHRPASAYSLGRLRSPINGLGREEIHRQNFDEDFDRNSLSNLHQDHQGKFWNTIRHLFGQRRERRSVSDQRFFLLNVFQPIHRTKLMPL